MATQVDPIEITGLVLLFASFLFVPQLTNILKSNLDTLPMRFAAIMIILGSLTYNKFLALGLFLVIIAIYIDHHHDEVLNVIGNANNISDFEPGNAGSKYSTAMNKLDHGGSADESYDSSDFTSKMEDQDNEFKHVDNSIDEKHTLLTEPLGSRSASLFPDDSKHVNALEQGNKDGYFD
jgi:hypothetical protein|uniref:Uncharacterized protein n=1 Tax=viral metagenome TaxID=1070528 RepID=A0A6C0DK74_9ZZZZ